MIIDISPPITPELRVFPGDTPMSREILMSIDEGDHVTVSTLRATVHLGAHADGPSHYAGGAPSIDAMPLDRYVGACQVVRVEVEPGARIVEADLAGGLEAITEARVLFRTDSFPDPTRWTEFAAFDPGLVRALAVRGVVTVGIDTPSVDTATSKDLPAHAAFAETGTAILEGLVLKDVEPGRYELIALPLRLVGFDGSPVRAVLRTLE